MKIGMGRRFLWVIMVCTILFLIGASGCGPLRTARIRKEVTLSTFRNPEYRMESGSVVAVIPLFHKEESLSGISFSANDAAAEMMSVKLWNSGFRIIDKIFVREVLHRFNIEFTDFSVKQATQVGEELGAEYLMLTTLTELEADMRSIDFGPFEVINTVDTSVLVGLNCRVVDVLSKRVVWSGVATTQDKNLQLALRRLSLHLIHTLINGKKNRPRDRVIPLIGIHY